MPNITLNVSRGKLRGAVIAATGLAVLGAGLAVAANDTLRVSTAHSKTVATSQAAPILNLPVNIPDVVEQVSSAVVSVQVTQTKGAAAIDAEQMPFGEFFKRYFGDEMRERFGERFHAPREQQVPQRQGIGSGFVIDKDGLIVTNHHVIDGTDKIEIGFRDGKKLIATVVGTDPKTDLALLKVEADYDLPFVKFGRSQEMRVGDWVLTMGNPFGLSQTATTGIISARHRNIGAGPFDDFLQIDAPINQGNSGGPAFNLKGEVIGVNTAIFSPSGGNVGIGFAIPSYLAEKIVADLRDDGRIKRGWLGVNIQSVSEDLAAGLEMDKASGALVSRVADGSPADRGGLRRGDVILAVDGQNVTSMRNLPILVASLEPGTRATFKVWRDGRENLVKVVIGESQENAKVEAVSPANAKIVGLELGSITPQNRRVYRLDENAEGVVVIGVLNNSLAARDGFSVGDVIVAVGNRPVRSPEDMVQHIQEAKRLSRKSVLLLVNRNTNERFVALTLRDA